MNTSSDISKEDKEIIDAFFNAISEDGWEKWEALVIIGGAQALLLFELVI